MTNLLETPIKVRAYRNLHTGLWSVKSMEGRNYGRVIMHCDTVVLNNAKFVVLEKGRQRVIKEGRKNVHAFAQGWMIAGNIITTRYNHIRTKAPYKTSNNTITQEVTYNPYLYNTFVNKQSLKPINYSLKNIFLNNDHSVTIEQWKETTINEI